MLYSMFLFLGMEIIIYFAPFTASPEPIDLTLTNQWLWEIIDEFVYQFQSFSQFRRSPKLNNEEMNYIRDHSYIWSVLSVLNVLYSLIEKSNINQQLKVCKFSFIYLLQ